MQLRSCVRIARSSTVVVHTRRLAAIVAMACAASVSAAEPPGQFVPDLPAGMSEVRALAPKPKTGPDSARGTPAEEMTGVWQPQHAGEKVEHAKDGPGRHLKPGAVKPAARDWRAR